jgi:hypothetical protein
MTSVAICIPSGDMVHADFALALAAMTSCCGPFEQNGKQYEEISLAFINTKGSLIANSRNKLVAEAQQLGVEYVFFIDSDVVVHQYTLRRLLELKQDIVGGTYIQREAPHLLLGKTLDGKTLHEAAPMLAINPNELMEMGGLPGGCLLVKTEVFAGMTEPYFQTPTHAADGDKPAWIEGEDYFFCRQARELGYKVMLDWPTALSISHLGQSVNVIPAARKQPEQEPANAIIH